MNKRLKEFRKIESRRLFVSSALLIIIIFSCIIFCLIFFLPRVEIDVCIETQSTNNKSIFDQHCLYLFNNTCKGKDVLEQLSSFFRTSKIPRLSPLLCSRGQNSGIFKFLQKSCELFSSIFPSKSKLKYLSLVMRVYRDK